MNEHRIKCRKKNNIKFFINTSLNTKYGIINLLTPYSRKPIPFLRKKIESKYWNENNSRGLESIINFQN